MKKAIILIFFPALVAFHSCSDKPKQQGNSEHVFEENILPKTLAGSVYGLCESIDVSSCASTPPGTDYFPTILFPDDRSFVKIINTCCGDVGEDFAETLYYTGNYFLTDTNLRLAYDSKMAVYYSLEIENPKKDSSQTKTHIEIEKSDISVENMERLDCKYHTYFKHQSGDWQEEFMGKNSESASVKMKEMKTAGVWDKLYGKK